MKFLKKVLILVLVVGVIWGVAQIGKSGGFEGFAGKIGEAPTETPKEIPLKFVVISDVHSDWKNFKKALEKAKTDMGIGPSFAESDSASAGKGFVVVVGDLTTIGIKSELLEAKKILDESGLKYYVIPGNHDIWWGRKFKKDVWREVFGESFTSFKENEMKFILVNNGDGIGGFEGFGVRQLADGENGEKQIDWLKKETQECIRVYCLVFMHMPLNHPTSLHVMGEENPSVASEAARLVKLFVENQVKEVFAGHLHFSSSYEQGGLKTTIVGAITSDRNLQSPKFLEVWKEDGRLEERDVFLSN